MNLLFRILYAAHARGTHHKLALDALTHLRHPQADAWRAVFLSGADRYIAGSKAPDDVFKDFKNHVLHPRDGYWGGAPDLTQRWYGDLVAALTREDWSEAAWCAGVLSHYFADPVHPFHTAQSAGENAIHRAVEWSINRAYDSLRAEGLAAHPDLDVAVPEGADWLPPMVRAGAARANVHYEALIAHYDFTRGVVDPPSGLDPVGRRICAELLIYAATGFARVLERALTESGATPPALSLTAETVLAALQVPRQLLLKKLGDMADRRQVEAMYDELMATGKVDATLPEDDRMVRDLHAAEVVTPQPASRAAPVAAPATPPRQAEPAPPAVAVASVEEIPMAPPAPSAPAAPSEAPSAPAEAPHRLVPAAGRPARRRLQLTDDVVDAPSIGPKTARRLEPLGIRSIADLLAADPAEVSRRLDVRHMTPDVVTEWQNQTRLVLAIPELTGTEAQLLTGAGFHAVEALAAADVSDLCAALLAFAATPAGERILRSGKPPDVAEIRAWAAAAAARRAA
ncbi:MAG: DUF4332 domain-containing protein [Hyphomicrobiaceae bacterium]